MRKLLIAVLLTITTQVVFAQSNWKLSGNGGTSAGDFLGTTDSRPLIFRTDNTERGRLLAGGAWRFGTSSDHVRIDVNGNLSFVGSSSYLVDGNSYVFRYATNPNYGLYFNSTVPRYEFRNGSATPVFHVNANNGNGAFNGTLKVGAYTLPSADGLNGQVLKTNGSGVLSWSNDLTGAGGGANLFLSNLSSPTAINQSLLPGVTNSTDIGSSSFSWKDIYAGGSLYLGGQRFLSNAGTENAAIGEQTLIANTTGYGNTGIGFQSLRDNTVGYYNTAAGDQALVSNTTGFGNAAFGTGALYFNTTGGYNTAIGYSSLQYNTTGYDNVGVGVNSLLSNTTGIFNVGIGSHALYGNTEGSWNVGIGNAALAGNTTGSNNIGLGIYSLYSNTSGQRNIAIGDEALMANTTISGNIAIGSKALKNNTTGNYNIALGEQALTANTSGLWNSATGFQTLYSNIDGNYNNAYGYQALPLNTSGSSNDAYGTFTLFNNTTGGSNSAFGGSALGFNTTGNHNVGVGIQALLLNTTGSGNTALGLNAIVRNTEGWENVAVGQESMELNTTGFRNIAVGAHSLVNNISGFVNIGIGVGADVTAPDLTNATAIGVNALVDANDKVRIGNTVVSSIGGEVSWTTFSDARYKKNIKEEVPGLSFINSLRPITYTVDINALNGHYPKNKKPDLEIANSKIKMPNMKEPSAMEKLNARIKQSEEEATKIVYTGFAAQEVEAAAKKLNYDFSGVDKPKTKNGLYGLRYSDFVVPLVKAIQETSKQMEEKDQKIAELTARIEKLERLLLTNGKISTQNISIGNEALLEQNAPNPFTNGTTIRYQLPERFSSAQIAVTDNSGKTLKQISLAGAGKGSLNIDASVLAAGTYNYSLYIDGRLIATKQMILTK